jgi:hypothetical protein
MRSPFIDLALPLVCPGASGKPPSLDAAWFWPAVRWMSGHRFVLLSH